MSYYPLNIDSEAKVSGSAKKRFEPPARADLVTRCCQHFQAKRDRWLNRAVRPNAEDALALADLLARMKRRAKRATAKAKT